MPASHDIFRAILGWDDGHTVDVGYRRDHLLTVMLFPQAGHQSTPNSPAYYQQLAEEMKRLPGVESVSFSGGGPANEFEGF